MISKRLRQVRLEHKMTQQNIADILGIDRTTYTFYETGVTKPSVITLMKLADIYQITLDSLLGIEQAKDGMYAGYRASASPCLNSGDPLSLLTREEKYILMCYRVLDDEGKEQAEKAMKEFAKQYGKKFDE